MEKDDARLAEIKKFLGGSECVDKQRVLAWNESENLDVIAELVEAVHAGWNRIVPPLAWAEWGELLLKLMLLGLKVRSQEYPAYVSARDYCEHVAEAFRNRDRDAEALDYFQSSKDTLARLYLEGDEDLKDCVVMGILEHLFEDGTVQDAFADWKEHAQLGAAYGDAALWGEIYRRDPEVRRGERG